MAFLKVWRVLRQQGALPALRKVMQVAPGYLGGIHNWRISRCRCCNQLTIFLAHRNRSAEFRVCLLCSANERYELLAMEIRQRFGERLREMDVLELDPRSPLKSVLACARSYTRSFYEEHCTLESKNGAIRADITSLQFDDNSLDLIVSSDVLEHVPRLDQAFCESARVLKVGGSHVFTVPPRAVTRKRAEFRDGELVHLQPPEYHLDPLRAEGILAFWDIGPDLACAFATKNLDIKIVRGPVGKDGRAVWMAEKTADPQGAAQA